MTWGKAIVVLIVGTSLVAGAAMWWLQTRAYYVTLDAATATVSVVPADGGPPRPIPVTDFRGIDSDSSPIRYRACFTTDPAILDDALFDESAVPLNAPGWFDCFDAEAIGEALRQGTAEAVVSRRNAPYGIDRILAIFPDGRGFSWPQINECGREVFEGRPAPEGCPPPPDREAGG